MWYPEFKRYSVLFDQSYSVNCLCQMYSQKSIAKRMFTVATSIASDEFPQLDRVFFDDDFESSSRASDSTHDCKD